MKKLILSSLMAASLAVGAAHATDRVAIGTGGTGGVFYAVGAGMADVLNKKAEGITAKAEVTGASIENIRRVSMGEMTMGFSSASVLFAGANGTEPFEEKQNVAAIAYLYPAMLQVAALKSADVKSIADLKDKRISVGPPGSNSSVIAERLLTAYDAYNPSNIQYLSYSEATNAMKDGNLDATMVLAGIPASALIELATSKDVAFVPVDEAKLADLMKEFPFYAVDTLPGGTYRGTDGDTPQLADPAILFTSTDADEELVYKVTKTLFDNLETLGAVHPMAKLISAAKAPNAPIALHPGAKRYFDEAK
ncbi:TAXI family TRAP transporter solute-binding subunit [Breoghania sp.]|uniref:TAXI family TRAP transporter solute-binding subunit n=1 Tax=Breoghania sp. TaxID=2065378 RepID=UPI0029CA430D|nr:TAXI family TRAP transporter solute-binding subunit [Breoghania sp.]